MKKKLISLFLILLVLLCGCGMDMPALTATASSPTVSSAAEDTLTVHYIDVGQADCALLTCGDHCILIDGGNVEDSSLVVSYLDKLGVTYLDLVVCTHAHEDHVGGLGGVLAVFETGAVWSPTTTYSSSCFDDFMHYADQQGLTVRIPEPGDTFTADALTLTVLGPTQSYADTNNTSIVLLAEFGDTRFLFTGDMETTAEADMLDYWDGMDWDVDVLKVGHHGSDTSTSYRFLYETDPEYGVISVGAGNSYGHPHDEPMSRLRDADVTIYRTDELGTILATSDGETITFSWQDTSKEPEDPTVSSEDGEHYIGNRNSHVFHLPTCSGLPAEKNQILFDSYDDATEAGYTPCSRCLP